jgi:hypothetical protein
MLLTTHEVIRKRTQNELKLSAQVYEIESEFELFDIVHAGTGNWISLDAARTETARLGRNPGDRGRIQEYREQSQNVAENKAHHFSKCCKLCAFGTPFSTNQTLKGARITAFCENEPTEAPKAQGRDETVTGSRLGRRMVFIGAVLPSYRVRDARTTAGRMPARHITG